MPPPDEDTFRALRDSALPHRCAFERALLTRCAACSCARPVLLAERESIGCASPDPSARCRAYHQQLRAGARFALRIEHSGPLPFGKAVRLQCGGLLGLRDALASEDGVGRELGAIRSDAQVRDGEPGTTRDTAFDTARTGTAGAAPTSVSDVDALIRRALQHYGGFDALPYSRIIRSVIRYEPRPRARR